VLIATYAYAIQIYADFSGYSDVAVGSAALFGYVLPENFAAPYLSSDLQEFWRRWHITLSTWLRDYLYKPLGGSRSGSLKTYRNLMITMVLGGLWHGASWTFVVWGALHGGALAATRIWQRAREAYRVRRAEVLRARADVGAGVGVSAGVSVSAGAGVDVGAGVGVLPWGRWVATIATFHFVCFAWIFFRAPTLDHAALALAQLVRGRWTLEHVTPNVILVLAMAALLHVSPLQWKERIRESFVRTPALVQGLVLAAAAVALHLAAGVKPEPFVYGQF
jgi:alginate O-acetyltransferase complex protein AlgI